MNISISDLINKIKHENINIIDIRSTYEYELGHIPKAKNIPFNYLLYDKERYINKNEVYYIYCDYGNLTKILIKKLNCDNLINISGGYISFKNIYKNL